MLLGNNIPAVYHQESEAYRYQPSFDLRKNIARIVAKFSLLAVRKKIVLDIFVSQEIPNSLQGNLACFLDLFSELLKHCLGSFYGGELRIRINHESLHRNNNCQIELSIIMTTLETAPNITLHEDSLNRSLYRVPDKNVLQKNFTPLNRIQGLCRNFNGTFSVQRLDPLKTRYVLMLVLQQARLVRTLQSA